jgi:polysaccharide export outer membrane protein
MKTKIIILISVLFSFLVSCKTQNLLVEKNEILDMKPFLFDSTYQYKIEKDDKVSISVWGEDGYSVGSVYGIYNSNEIYGKWLLVDANGNIEVPKIGTTNVLGKTIPELKEILKNNLKQWLINPVVDVKVLNKEITILGEVKNPNTIIVDKEHNTLLEIVSKAGGFEFYANLKSIKVLRQNGENVYVANIDLTDASDILNKNIQLHSGDIIIVPSKKNKEFDKRISTIIPFTTTVSAAAIILGLF